MKDREKYKDYFAGMVRCGDCGRTMYCVRYTHNYKTMEKVGIYYTCSAQNHTQNHCDRKLRKPVKNACDGSDSNSYKEFMRQEEVVTELKSDTSEKKLFMKPVQCADAGTKGIAGRRKNAHCMKLCVWDC